MKIYNPKTGKFEDEEEKQGNISANVYNPSSKQFENIKPVKNQEEKKSTWFNAGALQDGYQFGDIGKTILGTGADVAHRVVKGVAKVGEGIGDLAGYGAAQVVESLGNKKYADEMRKAANESLTDKVLAPVDKILDKNSILGKKSQGVGESLGQILAYSATGGLGKGVGTATMFTSAAGSAGNEAYSKENVKNEQAWTKILAGGAISAATEKAFGLFGKSGLDTAVANKISSKLTKGMSKTLARLGVQATSEALEELMEYTGNQLLDLGIDAASQGKGAKFHEDWNWEEVGQQMAMAAIASGIVGAGTTALGVKGTQGSNLQEKINNFAMQQDIQEGLTPKEQVKLPGIRTEQSLTKNIEQLKEQQKQTTDNKLKQELATRISGLEQELNQFKLPMASTEGMNLMESASKYNIKPETQSAVQNLMENRGIESRWDATKFSDNSVNALWTKDANGNRSVIFNPNASLDTIVEEVALHELTHDILSSENTTLNAQEILDYVSQLDGYNEARQSLENTYSTMYDPNSAEFNSLIDEEVVADVLGRKLGNQEFINQLVNSKPSVAKSIYNWVVSKLNSIVNKGKVRSEKLYWQNIKNNFENAYKQEYKNNEMASTKYKVSDSATIQERYNAIKNQRDDLRTQLYELRQQRNDIINTIPDYSMFKQYDELTEINKALDENKQKSIELYEEQKQLEKQLEKIKDKEKQAQIKEINQKSTPFKEKQFKIIQKYNPMLDDYHTGIRQPGEIRTWEEAMYDAEKDGEGYAWGDFTKEDAEKALKNKTITIYSSYPIKNGVFVTPSRIQAEQYAGGEGSRVYSKTVRPDSVAWINVDEGQYANVGINTYETKYSKENAEWNKFLDKNLTTDNQGRELTKDQVKYFENSKAVDENGNLITVYHTTTDAVNQFNEFNPVGTDYYKFGDQVVNYYTDSKEMSGSYASQKYEMADTKPVKSMEEVNDLLKEHNNSLNPDEKYDYLLEIVDGDSGGYKLKVTAQPNTGVTEEFYPRKYKNKQDLYKKIKEDIKSYKTVRDESGRALSSRKKLQYEGYVNITNPYVVDAEKRNWNQVIQKSNDFIDELDDRVPQEVKNNLTRLYRESENKSAELREEFNVLENAIRGMWNSAVDEDVKKVNEVVKRVGFNEIEDAISYDGKMGVMGVNGWYNIAEVLEQQGIIGESTAKLIIDDFKLPDNIKEYIQENYNKEIPLQMLWTNNASKLMEQLGKNTTLRDLYNTNQQKYLEFDKYRMPSSYFLEQISSEENDYLGNDLNDMFETRAEIYSPEQVGEEIAQAASVNFSKPELIRLWGTSKTTNDVVKEIIASNKDGITNYDGVIIKNVYDYGGHSETHEPADLYITFNSNQFKAADNENPTSDPDIRYSKQSEEWDKWNNKTIAPEGTKTKLKDIKLPKKEANLPKSSQVKQETRQEVKLPTRETITKEELEELDSLKALNEITDLDREEQNRLDYLEKKQQGYTERYPGLKKVSDFKEISKEYGKYRDLDNFDKTLLRDAESMIKGYRNTERRTKDEWLSIARYIGSNFKGNSEELQKYAIQSWFAASPNQKGSLNRQGKGFVDFKIQEWINSMYDGARVGELDKPSTPKKQTILPMAREDNVLKVNANEIADFMNGISGNQRGWAKTATESDVLKDKVLIKDLDASKLNYVVESNQKSVDTANNHLNTYGYEKSLEDVKSLLRSDKLPKASDVALAERVLQEAVRNGDTKTAQDLIMDIAILGTDLGQATQALSIIKRLTPEGQLSMYTKMIQRAKSRGEKSFENVEITPEMVEMVLNAYKSDGTYDQEDLNNRVENFKQEIANQMKTTTGEKINAWRYLAMLGNPKTHIRNIVSNVAMNGTIKVKNAMARTLESVLPVANRTKTWKKATNFIKNYAETTANEMKGIITGENKYNEKSSLESKKRTFKSDTLEKISNFNSNALEAEDWFFSKRAFKSNLEEYLTANGINTQEDIESRPEVVEKAKNYAKEQAEIATFRQYSKLAAQINNLEKNNKLARTFIEATVPFKKTPINVAKAGVKYSPLGLIKSLSYDIYQVKQGNMEASQLIDNISQGLTGTSLAILGYALAKNGILNGGGDDDKEGKYDTQLGDNQYSLKIGDKSYSISWLSPVAMPLLVGANAFEQLEEKEEWDMNVVSETLAKTLDPLNEMSFMQGLTNALSSYDKGVEKLAGIGESVAQNYVGQFFPTIFSQFASTIDDKKRSTKASANSTYKFGEQTLRSIMYKLPGLRQKLEVATDVWGNEKEQADNIIQRAYESFLAPYSTTKNITSDLDKEIKSIYNKTNETGVIPSVPYSYVKYKDETYRMSANDYTKYKKTFGQNANKYLNNLISSNAYKNASDDDKAKMIKNTYDYAKAEANEEYFKSQKIDYTSDTLKELNSLKKIGINDKSLPEYISNKTLASTIKSDSKLSANEKHQKIADNFIKSSLNDKQLAYLYGKYYSTDDKLNNLVELNIPIKEFIKLNSQDIESDYNERTGKTISNSKKNKVINYVNSLNLSIPQKAILIKSQYNTYKNYDNQIVNYVNNLNKSVNDKKVILKSIGFDNYDNDVINYINSQNMSIKDKEKKLKSLGFTIRDGRVYK